MSKQPQTQDQDQTIQKVQDKVKKVVFKVNNHLLKHLESFNEYIYYLLLLIETIQILWFSIHPTFQFISSSIGIKQFQTGIRYFSVEYYLRENPGSWSTCIIIAFVITIVHLLSLTITGYFLLQNKQSETAEFLAKVTNLQVLLMNTVLTIPMFNIVATTLYCDADSPYHLGEVCYTPTGIVYCVLACVVAVVMVVEGGLFGFLYFIKNPFSRSCLSTPSNIYYVFKFWLKTLPSLYFIIDSDLTYIHVYIFAFVIVFAGYIFLFRMFSTHTYDQKFHYFIYSCELTLTWIGLVNILQFYLSQPDKPNLSLIFSLFGIFPLCYTFIKLQKQSKKKIFLQGIRNIKKNKQVAEEFIYMVINLIETISVHKNKIQLLGFMKIHNGSCEEEGSRCNCHEYFKAFYEKRKFSPLDELNMFYEFLRGLLCDYMKKYPGHVVFKIMHSYLLYYKLESKIQSIYYVTETAKEKLSFAEDFLVYRLKLLFEEQSEEKDNDLSQDKGHAIKIYLEFNNLFMSLENEIELCSKNHLEYWRELKQDFPSILKLWNLAKCFENQLKGIERLYSKITEIYPNNVVTLILYSNFMKYIVGNEKEYFKLQDKIKSERYSSDSNSKDTNDMKFRENSNLCTVTITTHSNNIGIIINSNSELQRMLGYTKTEVIGQKITKIMPKSYYDLHDGFITKYLNRSDNEIESKEFTVFALCKKGFLVECNILTKLIPEIENGFHLVGFIKKVEETSRYTAHYIMYDGDNYNIEAISSTCVESLGLTSDNIEKGNSTSQITVNYLFPEIDFEELDNRPELKLEGFETLLDPRVVSEDYHFDSYQDDSDGGAYRNGRMNVKVYLIKQSTYNKLKLKFIKFFILNDDEDQQVHSRQKGSTKFNNHDSSSEQYVEYEQTNNEAMAYHKKYTEFVSEKSIKCLLLLLVVGVYLFMFMEVCLVSADISLNMVDSNEIMSTMDVLNHSSSLLNYIKNTNFDTKKLELTYKLNLSEQDFLMYQNRMSVSAKNMQNAIVEFIRILVTLQDKYSYKPSKIYDTYYFYNNNDTPITQVFQYNDAMFQYITTIVSFSSYSYATLNLPTITNTTIVSNYFFVQKNGITKLDNRTIANQVNIYAFFKNMFNLYLRNRQILLGLRLLSVMIIFCLILPIIVKLNKTNKKLLGIYKMIPLEDIGVIEEESWKFITSSFEEFSLKGKERHGVEENGSEVSKFADDFSLQNINVRSNVLPLVSDVTYRSSNLSPSSSLRPAETSDALLVSFDEQKVSLRRNSLNKNLDGEEQKRKIPKVKLSQIPSNKTHIIFLTVIIGILLGYCIGQYFLHNYMFAPFKQDQSSLYNYKTSAALCRQVMLVSQDYLSSGNNLPRFKTGSNALYTMIDALYSRFPDNNKNRQSIYGSIEQLKTIMLEPNLTIMMEEKFKKIERNMDVVEGNLNREAIQFIREMKERIRGSYQKVCIVKFVVEFIVVAVLIKVLFSGYLEKVKVRTHRSTSMALMIPVKIVMRNQEILALM